MQAVSKYHPLSHYRWGKNCDGWNLVANGNLAVKWEHMPAGTEEELHFHLIAQQFFFVLSGTATFDVAGETVEIKSGEGLEIPAGTQHRIINNSDGGLEFLLCSQPSTANDRINCNE
jgi:mannose-6-phosphate isomerase-like protein (cupin superfamily)